MVFKGWNYELYSRETGSLFVWCEPTTPWFSLRIILYLTLLYALPLSVYVLHEPTWLSRYREILARGNTNLVPWHLSVASYLVLVQRFPSPSRSIHFGDVSRRAGNGLTFSLGSREPTRFGRAKFWGLGTKQCCLEKTATEAGARGWGKYKFSELQCLFF